MKTDYKTEQCECNIVHSGVVEKVSAEMPDEETLYISALFVAELCVCDIASLLNMTKSAVSHQLRILRQTKIVKNRKSGKEVYYSLDDGHIAEIFKTALEHLNEN